MEPEYFYNLSYDHKLSRLGFTKVYNVLVDAYPRLSDGAFRAYVMMTSQNYYQSKNVDEIWIPQSELAQRMNKCPRQFRRYIKELKEVGLIRVLRRKGNTYGIHFMDFLEQELVRAFWLRSYMADRTIKHDLAVFHASFDAYWMEFQTCKGDNVVSFFR